MMLSIDHVRALLNNPALTDDDVGVIRDACQALAESIIDACENQHTQSQEDEVPGVTAPSHDAA